MKHRKRFWMLLSAGGAGAALLLLLLLTNTSLPVLRINGVFVGEEEFRLFQARSRASVIGMLQRDYGVEYGRDYWSREVNGKKTAAYLQEAAKQELIRVTVTETLLRNENLLPYADFRELKQLWEQTNAVRRQAVEAHQVVYGPVEYGLDEFRTYILSNGLIAWENQLIQAQGPAVTTEELENFRQTHADSQLSRTPTVVVLAYWGEDETEAEQAVSAWKAGQEMPDAWADQFRAESMIFSEENKSAFLRCCPELWELVMQAEEGDVIGPLTVDGQTVIGKVASVTWKEEPVEARRDWYLHKYFEHRIQQSIEEAVADARVVRIRPFPKPENP